MPGRISRGRGGVKKLTVREAAALLECSEKSVYRWIRQGLLPAYRINDQYRINRAELLEWATARKLHVSPEIFAAPEGEGGLPPALEDARRGRWPRSACTRWCARARRWGRRGWATGSRSPTCATRSCCTARGRR